MTRITIFPIILVFMSIMGCNNAQWLTGRLEPMTQIGINPLTRSFKFKDTKNNNVTITGLKMDKSTGLFEVEKVTIVNNSSEVIAADAARMQFIIEAQKVNVDLHRQIGANIAMALAAGGDAAGTLISKLPNLNVGIDTAFGSGTLGITQPHAEPNPEKTGE